VIYPVDSAIHPLNNWVQINKTNHDWIQYVTWVIKYNPCCISLQNVDGLGWKIRKFLSPLFFECQLVLKKREKKKQSRYMQSKSE
jgi:hypothetical protein